MTTDQGAVGDSLTAGDEGGLPAPLEAAAPVPEEPSFSDLESGFSRFVACVEAVGLTVEEAVLDTQGRVNFGWSTASPDLLELGSERVSLCEEAYFLPLLLKWRSASGLDVQDADDVRAPMRDCLVARGYGQPDSDLGDLIVIAAPEDLEKCDRLVSKIAD